MQQLCKLINLYEAKYCEWMGVGDEEQEKSTQVKKSEQHWIISPMPRTDKFLRQIGMVNSNTVNAWFFIYTKTHTS